MVSLKNDIPSHIAIAIDWCPTFDETHPLHTTCEACAPLAAEIAAAIREERERCAQTAESFIPSGFRGARPSTPDIGVARDDRARTIAAAIRALPDAPDHV